MLWLLLLSFKCCYYAKWSQSIEKDTRREVLEEHSKLKIYLHGAVTDRDNTFRNLEDADKYSAWESFDFYECHVCYSLDETEPKSCILVLNLFSRFYVQRIFLLWTRICLDMALTALFHIEKAYISSVGQKKTVRWRQIGERKEWQEMEEKGKRGYRKQLLYFQFNSRMVGRKEEKKKEKRLIPSNALNRITIENDTSNLCVCVCAGIVCWFR